MKKSRLFPKKRLTGLLALALAGLLPLSGVLAADYADGVYQDLAPGYNDDVIVSVTVRDGKITEFDAKNRNGNESEYFGKALEGIRQAVLEKQGLEGVDAASASSALRHLGGKRRFSFIYKTSFVRLTFLPKI